MGNLNGKFDASTVNAYTRINLIKRDSYESKKSATDVLTKRSAKALSLVKSGFDKRFGSKKKSGESNNDADAFISASPFQDGLSTPSAKRSSARLQFTSPTSPNLATPSPDKEKHIECLSPFESYPSVTDQPLRRMLPHEIVGLSDGDQITLVVTDKSHKFSSIRDAVISSGGELSDHTFVREADTMYEFPVHLHHFQDRDSIAQGVFSDNELKLKFGSQGDGFTVTLAIYGIKYGVRFKDILDGRIEIYQEPSDDYEHPDFFEIAGRSRDPTNYASYYTSLLDMTHGDQNQTQRVLVSYYRQKIETLQTQNLLLNSKLDRTEERLNDLSQSLVTPAIVSSLAESELFGPDYDSFLGMVDNCYEMAIRSHFCMWQNADVPLLPESTHSYLMKTFESQFPITAGSLQAMALTKINKEPANNMTSNVSQKRRIAFHSFLALSRVRNPYKLTWWAITDSLASASRGIPNVGIESTIWRKYALSYRATYFRLNQIATSALISIRVLLYSINELMQTFHTS
jgi:hypothetical protein